MNDAAMVFDAYSNGELWNGWEKPMISKESADGLCACMPNVKYDEARDAFIIEPYEGSGDEETVVPAQLIEGDGSSIKVYGIGAGDWTWDRIEQEADGEAEPITQRASP